MAFFPVGDDALKHLSGADSRLAAVIEAVGPVRREMRPNLFDGLMHCMSGQQISTKAHMTVWGRLEAMTADRGGVIPSVIAGMPPEELQTIGISFRKALAMREAAAAFADGALSEESLREADDAAFVAALIRLRGVGVWTAEMLLLFSLGRMDVFSWDDLAIRRGLRMAHRQAELPRAYFERWRRRYSPFGSVASLYLWAVAGGAVPGLRDPAVRTGAGRKR